MGRNARDVICGAAFAAIGLFFALYAWWKLPMGSAFQMGPGFFPILLGLVLAGFGVAVAAQGIGREPEARSRVSWRGVLLVLGAVLVFALFARPLGFAPTLAIAAFLAAMAPREATWGSALLSSIVLTAFSVGIFVLALRLPYPILGPWLGG